MNATGGTSIGCGLDMIREKKLLVNGIAVCSDGGDNTYPLFGDAYKKYCSEFGIDPTVYHYHVPGDPNDLAREGVQLEKFDLGYDPDYYALPQLAMTMRTSRYALVEDILKTKLLRFEDVFKQK
jgi:hypothetical protein